MTKAELYLQIYQSFKDLCANGLQTVSFRAYCRSYGVSDDALRHLLGKGCVAINRLPGYRQPRHGRPANAALTERAREIYENFKQLCAEGKQPGSFYAYCKECGGVTRWTMARFLRINGFLVKRIPGYRYIVPPDRKRPVENPRVPLCREVYDEFKRLCASGQQTESLASYCRKRGVNLDIVRRMARFEYSGIRQIPGYHTKRFSYKQSVNHCISVYEEFRRLCSQGEQPTNFSAYCLERGVCVAYMYKVIRKKGFPHIKDLEGYSTGYEYRTDPKYKERHTLSMGIYNEFKRLCAEGKPPTSFTAYCRECGVSVGQMRQFLAKRHLRVIDIPGYRAPGPKPGVPFENVIFEEAGFLPASPAAAITVKVDGRTEVSFPADTQLDVVIEFVKKLGKEADNVES